jgi:hypothetical protein
MPEEPIFRDAMISLFNDAREMCVEMVAFKPDLIAATLESGWYLTLAAKTLWEKSSIPFPPIIRINIGSEKVDLFEQLDTPLRGIQKSIHVLNCRTHEFLAWLIDQKEWQSHLEKQIKDTLGEDHLPERILIVDSKPDRMFISLSEQDSDSTTAIGLLDLLFPQARIRAFEGKSRCQAALVYAWLNQCYPQAAPGIKDDWDQQLRNIPYEKRFQHPAGFFSIASGVERGPAESISWRTLTLDSPLVHAWKHHLPLESWLELPEWVEETIPCKMLYLAAGPDAHPEPSTAQKSLSDEIIEAMVQNFPEIMEPVLGFLKQQVERLTDIPRTSIIYDQTIPLTSRIMRDVYHDGRITSAQVCSRYHVTRREAVKNLGYCIQRNELYPQGKGRGKYYIASPEYTFILQWSNRRQPRPADEYEVLPEQLWLGDMPGEMPYPEDRHNFEMHLFALINKGFTYLIKPSVQPEADQQYDREMAEFLDIYCPSTKFHEYDLGGNISDLWDGWMPRYEKIFQIVSELEEILNQNHKVYISMSEFGHLIVQCLMARRLGSTKKAFDYLKNCRARSIYYWRYDLSDAHHRSYVRQWVKRYCPENQNKR